MDFKIFDEQAIEEELKDMFSQLNSTNYAISNLDASEIRRYSRKQHIKVSVTAHPRDTTFIVKLTAKSNPERKHDE